MRTILHLDRLLLEVKWKCRMILRSVFVMIPLMLSLFGLVKSSIQRNRLRMQRALICFSAVSGAESE